MHTGKLNTYDYKMYLASFVYAQDYPAKIDILNSEINSNFFIDSVFSNKI